ncbi:MAG: bifunctional [glutamine synthetase] adenylyltransferase/[glutamine synthetase]-adenylyl-L-tyrosine phosphorylase [Alphaproteobacteria bacterium]
MPTRGGGRIAVGGHNIKLGRGGIREIEFFAQTQQLIWGGREPSVRSAGTCDALRSLAAAGHIDTTVADSLVEAYGYLRQVEHRLQMVEDRQTQTLPGDPERLREIAIFMGCADVETFSAALTAVLETVERHYAALFEEAPALSGSGNLVFTGTEEDPGTLDTLMCMGFTNPVGVSATIRGWHHGRYRAVRSARAREQLTELVPILLEALGRTATPDAAFMKFDAFLQRLPEGIQIFSLFQANPHLLEAVAEILGNAPRLAEQLSRSPRLLDHMLTPGFLDPLPDVATLSRELEAVLVEAFDYEEVLDLCRRWANERRFQIGIQTLRDVLSPAEAGRSLTRVAEVVLSRLYVMVEREFSRQHGQIPGGDMAVIAMGKTGGAEMTAASDLDLILVYEAPDAVEVSTGPRPLPPAVFYTRLAQRYINAITTPTAAGNLYEVDMRLRPSGSKGPLAVSLEAFEKYQLEAAWTWEHMALTRARVIHGRPELAARLTAAIHDTLCRKRDPDRLVVDVADMRERLVREKPAASPWIIKYVRGGLVDVEFIAQYLQLLHAPEHPEILSPNTAEALDRLASAERIGAEEAQTLGDAHTLWMALHGVLRQSLEETFDDRAPAGLKRKLCAAARIADFGTLKATMEDRAAAVMTLYQAWIDLPAARVRTGAKTNREEPSS